MNAIDPNSVLAHELSAEMMEAMNNYDGAVVELKKAVEMAPQRPGAHYKLGDAYLSLSQLDSATEQFQAELSVDPANCIGPVEDRQRRLAAERQVRKKRWRTSNKALSMPQSERCPGGSRACFDQAEPQHRSGHRTLKPP